MNDRDSDDFEIWSADPFGSDFSDMDESDDDQDDNVPYNNRFGLVK